MSLIARRLGFLKAATENEQEERFVEYLARQVAVSELDRAVLLALDQVYGEDGTVDEERSRFYVPNAFVLGHCRRHPSRFLFGASVNPHRKDALEALEHQKERGAVLVKLLPNSQGFDPANPRLAPYYRKLVSLGLPLLIHCGFEHAIPTIDQSLGQPSRLRLALTEGVTVIVAHAGGAGRFHRNEMFGEFLALLNEFPNCFGDTSALANFWRTGYLKALLKPECLERRYGVAVERPFDRLIHGSDFPAPTTPAALGHKVAREARAATPDKRNVLQLDIAVKRAAGVPDACLTRAHEALQMGR
jgi:predicted TIM-barrel fold metal-dependent hydrolase